MTARHFVYGFKHPATGEKTGSVGMITILKEGEMDRVPEGAIEVGDNPVPEDKEGAFFEAWELTDDSELIINLEKARAIRMEWLRKRRDQFLRHLDGVQFRYYCSKDQVGIDKVEEEKQELRDCPESINWDVITTLHDIKHILPPILI